MSDLPEIRRAYEHFRQLLDQEIRKRSGDVRALERYRHWLDTAFYLLAWGHFEDETRKRARAVVAEEGRRHGRARHAWTYLQERFRDFGVARQIDLIFNDRPDVARELERHYLIRNESAHGAKRLPSEARDLPGTIDRWDGLIDRF